jgi:hypothetical protein
MITDNVKYNNSLHPIVQGWDSEFQPTYYYKLETNITTNTPGQKAGTYKTYYYKSSQRDSFGVASWRIGRNIMISNLSMGMSWEWGNYYMTDISDEVTSVCSWTETITAKALDKDEVELGIIGVISYSANQSMARKPATYITTSAESFVLNDGSYSGPLAILQFETAFSSSITGSKAVPPGYLLANLPGSSPIVPAQVVR